MDFTDFCYMCGMILTVAGFPPKSSRTLQKLDERLTPGGPKIPSYLHCNFISFPSLYKYCLIVKKTQTLTALTLKSRSGLDDLVAVELGVPNTQLHKLSP